MIEFLKIFNKMTSLLVILLCVLLSSDTIYSVVGVSNNTSDRTSESENATNNNNSKSSGIGKGMILNTTIYPLPQLSGFNSSLVTSGPIVLFDEKTIFIANLNFHRQEETAHFWAQTESSGFTIPDENGSLQPLGNYKGKNHIWLVLPANWTMKDVTTFGISSDVTHTFLESKDISEKDKNSIREHKTDEQVKQPFLVPRCCELGTRLIDSVCTPYEDLTSHLEFPIYNSNKTHIDPNVTLTSTTLDVQTYVYLPKCDPWELPVDLTEETNGFIYNMSLIVRGHPYVSRIYPHGHFCMDESKSDTQYDTITYACVTSTVETPLPDLYLPLLIISMICFAACAICYWFLLKVRDVHRICFVIYCTAMCFTFLSLVLLQTNSGERGCMVIGSMFVFTTMLSFTWLAILTIDLICLIRGFKMIPKNNRMYWYVGASFGIALLVLILSLTAKPSTRPNVPSTFVKRYPGEHCIFQDCSIQIFFTPLGLLILLSILGLTMCFREIRRLDATYNSDFDWLENISDYKFLLRSYLVIVILASFWMTEVIFNLHAMQQTTKLAFDLIEASLGIVTTIIFVLNRHTQKDLKVKLMQLQWLQRSQPEIPLRDIPTPVSIDSASSSSRRRSVSADKKEENDHLIGEEDSEIGNSSKDSAKPMKSVGWVGADPDPDKIGFKTE